MNATVSVILVGPFETIDPFNGFRGFNYVALCIAKLNSPNVFLHDYHK